MAKWCGVSFWGDQDVPKLIVMVVAHIWDYTTSHWFVHFIFALPRSMRDLSSLTRDGTHAPCSGSAEF